MLACDDGLLSASSSQTRLLLPPRTGSSAALASPLNRISNDAGVAGDGGGGFYGTSRASEHAVSSIPERVFSTKLQSIDPKPHIPAARTIGKDDDSRLRKNNLE